MATWSHFTAFLDGSRVIATAERDELFDNLRMLLAGAGCSSSGYAVHTSDQGAIKSSGLLTDLVSLDTPGGNTSGTIQAMALLASSAFSNHTAAVTTALSGEGLTLAERNAILDARIDDYRLWNYYKRLIDALTCKLLGSVECRTRSVSKNKCGFTEYAGYESFPPRYYASRSLSGSQTQISWTGEGCTGDCAMRSVLTFSGACTFDKGFCQQETFAGVACETYYNSGSGSSCTEGGPDGGDSAICSVTAGPCVPYGSDVYTATTRTITGTGCEGSNSYSGVVTETLSNEYTTTDLWMIAASAVTAATPSSYGLCDGLTAFYTITSDQVTIAARQMEYRFNFTAALPSGMKLMFDILGADAASICINMTSGVTSYVYTLAVPSYTGALSRSRSIANVALVAGSC